MFRVGIGLGDIFALNVHALVSSRACLVEHIRNAETGLGIQRYAPVFLKCAANFIVLHGPVAGQLVRE